VEGALYRGSEIDRLRPDDRFARVVAGALWSPGDSTISIEYFHNGEGMDDSAFDAYLDRLDRNLTSAQDPRLPPQTRSAFLAAWSADAAIPFSSNLGLRRHYGSATFSQRDLIDDLTVNLRAVAGFDDHGLIVTPGLAYAPPGHFQMSLDVVLLVGPQTAEYKLAPVRRAFQARVKYVF